MTTSHRRRRNRHWQRVLPLPCLTLSLLLFSCAGEDQGAATPSASAEWPFFNHDHANSRANAAETKLAPDTVSGLVPRWRFDGLSAVTSTPAVVGGVAYFGDWSGVFHAVRASDGTEIWNQKLGSPIRPSPLVAGDRVYTPESNGKLHALNRDAGDIIWSATLDTQPLISIDSSPVLADHTIVIGIASFEQGIKKTDYAFRGGISPTSGCGTGTFCPNMFGKSYSIRPLSPGRT